MQPLQSTPPDKDTVFCSLFLSLKRALLHQLNWILQTAAGGERKQRKLVSASHPSSEIIGVLADPLSTESQVFGDFMSCNSKRGFATKMPSMDPSTLSQNHASFGSHIVHSFAVLTSQTLSVAERASATYFALLIHHCIRHDIDKIHYIVQLQVFLLHTAKIEIVEEWNGKTGKNFNPRRALELHWNFFCTFKNLTWDRSVIK